MIKFIIYGLVFYAAWYVASRVIFPLLFGRKQKPQNNFKQDNTINRNDDEGEYIDYEEIQ